MIKTDDFILRDWNENDISSLVKYANNPLIAANLTDKFPHPYTEENGKAFIGFAEQHDTHHIFAIEINGEASGGIGIHPQSDIQRLNAELGYWLAEPYWGRSIISKAIPLVVDFAFTNLPITRIFARPFARNIASQKVLEKNGFVLEARIEKSLIKNGVLEDELIYAIRKNN
jgi:RimJ/RimL family protein N-acetyltransferase